MRPLALVLIAFAAPSLAFALAGSVGPGGGSMTYEQIRDGTMLFPAAICPDVGQRYEELTGRLLDLRTAIQTSSQCNADEKSTVDGFADLVGRRREEFWALIRKGRGTVLSAEEAAKAQDYVAAVTDMGGRIADLILGSPCFKDDKRGQLGVDVIASLVSEATGALSTVAGPYGPLLNMGGKITSTLITSLDKIVRSRRTYDFAEPEQRKVFVKAMCSYNGLRPEIDEISRVDRALADMRAYRKALGGQLAGMTGACDECRAIARRFNDDYKAGEAYTREPTVKLLERFHDLTAAADARFVQPIGTQTVLTLRSWVWADDELARLNRNLSDFGDVERDRVVEQQDVIEDFLFVKSLPALLSYYQGELEARVDALGVKIYRDLARLNLGGYYASPLPLAPSFAKLFDDRPEPTYFGQFPSRREWASFREISRQEADRQLGGVVSALQVIEKNCLFARAAGLKYEQALYKVCDVDDQEFREALYGSFYGILTSSRPDSATLKMAFEIPTPASERWAAKAGVTLPQTGYVWTANWLQSLVLLMDQLKVHESALYELRDPPPGASSSTSSVGVLESREAFGAADAEPATTVHIPSAAEMLGGRLPARSTTMDSTAGAATAVGGGAAGPLD